MNGNQKKSGLSVPLLLTVLAGILVAVLGYRQYVRFTTTEAWVAARDLPAGDVVAVSHLVRAQISGNGRIPINDPKAIVGHRLSGAKSAGTPFYPGDLERPPQKWAADQIPPGYVLFTLTPRDPALPYKSVRLGDRLDVLATSGRQTRIVAREAQLVGYLGNENGNGNGHEPKGRSQLVALAGPGEKKKPVQIKLVLAVKPEDVFPLAQVDERERLGVVLHGTSEVEQGKLLEIEPTRSHRLVELINGQGREHVRVRL